MQEIEILVELHEPIEAALAALDDFLFKGIKETHDIYYYDPLREKTHWNGQHLYEGCRIREQDGKCRVAYKVNHFDDNGHWLYADEYETSTPDAETLKTIFHHMGMEELITVETKRYVFVAPLYEITIDDVKNLGLFMEVEYKGEADEAQTVQDIKAAILLFMQGLGLKIGDESRLGKPELMLQKISLAQS